jgi:hypothetical protein
MSPRFLPNAPCWCGSGLKYKKCHRDRADGPRVNIEELLKTHDKAFGDEYCLHPEASSITCSGKIVRAHTIQRSGGLTRIARQGHVYTHVPRNFLSLAKTDGKPAPRLVGVKEASTFTGFCGAHDSALFRPLETVPFDATIEQCFLLAFRAISKELFAKQAQLEYTQALRKMDQGQPLEMQVIMQRQIAPYIAGVERGLRDMTRLKQEYDAAYAARQSAALSFYVIFMDRVPEFMCSGAVHPEVDFSGNVLQVLSRVPQVDNVTYSVIGREDEGAVVFAWVGESKAAASLVRSLDALPDGAIPAALTRFTFEFFENVFYSPDWWESLAGDVQRGLIARAGNGTPASWQHDPACLKDDGLRPVHWKVLERRTNVC